VEQHIHIWRAQAAAQQLTAADLTTFKNDLTRWLPAYYYMDKNARDLSPPDKTQLWQRVVEPLPTSTEDDRQLKARAAQALMPIREIPLNMRSRDGWAALNCQEIQTAISEARIQEGGQPATITTQYNAGGFDGALAPIYQPPDADIQYAVAMQSYMVHLAKDPQTGAMKSSRCKPVRQLAEAAIRDASDDRTVTALAVSRSWRFRSRKFMALVVEFQANKNKLPVNRKRQRPEEGEGDEYDDCVVRKLIDDNAKLQHTVTQQQRTAAQLQPSLQEANNRLHESGLEQVQMPDEEESEEQPGDVDIITPGG
jgi:hypothetical protein